MKEFNKKVLHMAIGELPQYAPPPEIWGRVEGELASVEQEEAIAEMTERLPAYTPPAFIWDGIEAQLSAQEKPAKVRAIPIGVRRMIAVAAAATGIVLTVVFSRTFHTETQLTYSEEVIEEAVFTSDWNSDEEDFEIVLAELEGSNYLGQIPEIQDLKYELDELNEAKAEIEAMMDQYGTDVEFVENIKEIEMERTEVIKKLATFI
jgi:hypothetical protein